MPGSITQDVFGQTKEGENVARFTLSNSSGSLVVRIINYGGTITEINVPDRNGKVDDVNLSLDDMAGYERVRTEPLNPRLGALIGRVANNISGGQFTLDGKIYKPAITAWNVSQHGGNDPFDQKMWKAKVDGGKLVLTYVSADGEGNFPGELTTTVVYSVTDDNELVIEYEATTTKPTPVCLTSHAYFNLAGHGAGILDDHHVTIAADSYLPMNEGFVPTGEIRKVEGTEWDLRKPVRLGDRLRQVFEGKGYCHTFCLSHPNDGELHFAARVEHPPSGRCMECLTTEPGVVFYTSYFLNQPKAKGGAVYKSFGALCLEAQHYPDSVNQPSFPSTILRPGEKYRQTTVYKFGII